MSDDLKSSAPHAAAPPAAVARRGAMDRLARWAVRHGSRRRAIGWLSAASIGDFFVPALPTQTSVMALGMMQPRRAAWVALAFAAAAALGAALLALLLGTVEGYARQFGESQVGPAWADITARVRAYGAWAVLAASVLPTPPRLLVAATLLAGSPAAPVVAAVFMGKLLWFALFLLLLVRARSLLARVPVLGTAVDRFETFKAQVLAAEAARKA